MLLQVVPAALSDGYTPPCRSVEASSDQQPLPRRTPTVCCRPRHGVQAKRCSFGRLLLDVLVDNVLLVASQIAAGRSGRSSHFRSWLPQTPCGVRPLCREYGRCCRDWAGEASLHPQGHAVRQVSQASENVLLGRAIPARECACTRTRTTSA